MVTGNEALIVIQIDLKRVFIEEALSVERKSRDHGVIKNFFDEVRIDRIVFEAEHSVREEHERDRRAGLRISLIVEQVIADGEGFLQTGRADAARDVHFLRYDVGERRFAGLVKLAVIGLQREVRHRGIHIAGAHAMSDRLGLLADGEVGLRGFRDGKLLIASVVEEVFRELQVTEVIRRAVHTDERKLDLLMSGGGEACRFFGHERLLDAVDVFFHELQKSVLARHLIVGDRRLHQVSRAVKLVPIAVGEALFGRAGDEVGVEITVLALIFFDLINDPFDLFYQNGVVFLVQDVRRALHPFGNVGIPEDVRFFRLTLLPIAREGGNSARIVKSVINSVNGDILIEKLLVE